MTLSARQKERRRTARAVEWLGDALWSLCQPGYSFRGTAYLFLRAGNIGEAECEAILAHGPEPEPCPSCGGIYEHAYTTCGGGWEK